jgi:hypothetical protein
VKAGVAPRGVHLVVAFICAVLAGAWLEAGYLAVGVMTAFIAAASLAAYAARAAR